MHQPIDPSPIPPKHVRITLTSRRGTHANEVLVDDDPALLTKLRSMTWRRSEKGYLVTDVPATRRTLTGFTTAYLHQVVWLHYHGSLPPKPLEIDHRNRDKADNTTANLRPADQSLQALNRPRRRDNTTGYVGVSWNCDSKKYQAKVGFKGRYQFLGYFSDPAEAARKVNAFYSEHHPEVDIPNPHANVPPPQPPKVILNANQNQPVS